MLDERRHEGGFHPGKFASIIRKHGGIDSRPDGRSYDNVCENKTSGGILLNDGPKYVMALIIEKP